jgi:hypothetical protein
MNSLLQTCVLVFLAQTCSCVAFKKENKRSDDSESSNGVIKRSDDVTLESLQALVQQQAAVIQQQGAAIQALESRMAACEAKGDVTAAGLSSVTARMNHTGRYNLYW